MAKKVLGLAVILALALSSAAYAGLFENTKVTDALGNGTIKVGMSKADLIAAIGYPPEGKPKQDSMFYRFAQSKVTASGKEDSWTYQIGATAEGVRSVTFKLVDDKVAEWNEWLDTKK